MISLKVSKLVVQSYYHRAAGLRLLAPAYPIPPPLEGSADGLPVDLVFSTPPPYL